MKIQVTESLVGRRVEAPGYHAMFMRDTGVLLRWGETSEEDPVRAPAPELLDIEIGTSCHGPFGKPCSHCYKSSSPKGKEMSLGTFEQLLERIPPTVFQLAFGIGDIGDYMWPIFMATRARGIIPNVTVNGAGVTTEVACHLASVCSGVAVSRYGDGELCYDAVQKLVEAGVKQVTIHQILAEETLEDCRKLQQDACQDKRLSGLQAVSFLMLKPKGRGKGMMPLRDLGALRELTQQGLDLGRVGFDSCSAPAVVEAMKDTEHAGFIQRTVEPCESGLFSLYIDVSAHAFPCSFAQGTPGWETGIDVLAVRDGEDFIERVWNHPRLLAWVDRLQAEGRSCPIYDICGRE